MAHRIDNKGRREDIYFDRKIDEILPEHIVENYPNLTKFIETYYQFLDSDGTQAFQEDIHNILSFRDISESPAKFLNNLAYELGSQLENTGKFDDDRFSLKRLAYLYREKGTKKGVEEFFKLFFQTDVEVIYPKKDIFIVGEDEIGPDYEHFIQDYKLYQNYSLLLKVGLSLSQYEFLYKKFMHPAGWYFQGETSFTSRASLAIGTSEIIPDSGFASYITEVEIPQYHMSRYTSLVPNADGVIIQEMGGYHYSAHDSGHMRTIRIEDYLNVPAWRLNPFYTTATWGTPNSFTFDDSALSNFRYDGKHARSVYEGKTTSNYVVVNATHYSDSNHGYLDSNAYVFGLPFGGGPYTGSSYGFNGPFSGSKKQLLWGAGPFPSIPALGPKITGVYIETDWTQPDFDSSAWVNPEHYVGKSMSSASDISANIPGGLIRGAWLAENYPNNVDSGVENFYYRLDSDAYYYFDSTPGPNGGAALTAGTLRPTPSMGFAVSRMRWIGKDSVGPDFSMDSLGSGYYGYNYDSVPLETFDNDMFTRYNPWYHNIDSSL
tara:strand:+ start:3437 stop:5077 length:1641 start_codon:yes stop_codon:yes gene_type:complete